MRSRDHRRRLGASLAAGFLVVGLALTGCSSAGSSNSGSAGADQRAPGAAAAAPAAGAAGSQPQSGATGAAPTSGPSAAAAGAASNRSVSYSGEIQLRCAHVDAAVTQAQTLVQSVGGYLDSEQVGNAGTMAWNAGGGTAASATPLALPSDASGEGAIMVLRIPSASYDAVFGRLGSLGTVLAQQRSSQDVTAQVVDLDARVASEKASIDRLDALMKQAGSLNDMITLEQAVTQRESDLNSLESQVAALRGQVAMSTVTVEFFQTATPPPPAKPKTNGAWSAAGHALASGWHALYMVGRGLLIAVSASFPFLVLAALIAYVAYRFTRRGRKDEAPEE